MGAPEPATSRLPGREPPRQAAETAAAPAATTACRDNRKHLFLLCDCNKKALSLIISWCLFLLGEFASSRSRAFSFDLVGLSIGESGMLRSPTINVWDLMDDLSFSNVSFIY
ncbi:hypothetical protein STEG23_009094, partial [Scotinomys teguina]